MRTKIFLFSCLSLCYFGVASAQLQTIFFDDFETYADFAISNVGGWTLTNVDQLPKYGFEEIDFPNSGLPAAFIVFNSHATTPSLGGTIWDAYSGDKSMVAFASASEEPGGIPVNNGWLISPKISLLESSNQLRFWARSSTVQYGKDRFKVGVSTTDTDIASFQIISQGNYLETIDDWQEFTFDLNQYADQDVYLAINCVSTDTFGFMVDDFLVEGSKNASTNKFLASQFEVFPNPAIDVVNFSNSENILVSKVIINDLNGRMVKTIDFGMISESLIDVSQLQSGVYFLNFITNGGEFTKKIIKR